MKSIPLACGDGPLGLQPWHQLIDCLQLEQILCNDDYIRRLMLGYTAGGSHVVWFSLLIGKAVGKRLCMLCLRQGYRETAACQPQFLPGVQIVLIWPCGSSIS